MIRAFKNYFTTKLYVQNFNNFGFLLSIKFSIYQKIIKTRNA